LKRRRPSGFFVWAVSAENGKKVDTKALIAGGSTIDAPVRQRELRWF
jgi:hypothetical protein